MNRCFYLYALKFFEKIKENNIVKNAMKRDMLVMLIFYFSSRQLK